MRTSNVQHPTSNARLYFDVGLTFNGGDHMVCSGRRIAGDRPRDDHFHELILQGSTAYWDAYLRGDESAKKWLKEDYVKVIGTDGVFELK